MKYSLIFLCLCFLSQSLFSQNTKTCPPIPAPLLGYTVQGFLKSGISAEYNIWFNHRDCDCNSTFGFLCYLIGMSTGLKAQYFFSKKYLDISANIGYRNINLIPFCKISLEGGYSLGGSIYPNFFHLDPTFSIDILSVIISGGYSFRSEKIDNKVGSFVFHVAISPLLFIKKSRPNQILPSFFKTSKAQRKQFFRKS